MLRPVGCHRSSRVKCDQNVTSAHLPESAKRPPRQSSAAWPIAPAPAAQPDGLGQPETSRTDDFRVVEADQRGDAADLPCGRAGQTVMPRQCSRRCFGLRSPARQADDKRAIKIFVEIPRSSQRAGRAAAELRERDGAQPRGRVVPGSIRTALRRTSARVRACRPCWQRQLSVLLARAAPTRPDGAVAARRSGPRPVCAPRR
eukprot:1077270-Prymnesium_polylepis.3